MEPVYEDPSASGGGESSGPILEGSRNNTMSRFAIRVLKRYGDTDKAHEAFTEHAEKCDPPLPDRELKTIWNSAEKFYNKMVVKQPDYVPPDKYNEEFGGYLKPEDYTDMDEVASVEKALIQAGIPKEIVMAGEKEIAKVITQDTKPLLFMLIGANNYRKFVLKRRDYKYIIATANTSKPMVVGMAAIGKVYQEHMIIAYGGGANGKSTFWNTIFRVMGSYAGKLSAESLTMKCKRNIMPELAELKGRRLVISSEMQEGMRLNTSVVKQLCLSSSPIQTIPSISSFPSCTPSCSTFSVVWRITAITAGFPFMCAASWANLPTSDRSRSLRS